jgi:hypothetical protein
MSEKKTVISPEPVLINLLRRREPFFPNIRIFREDILLRAGLIGQRLRDPQFFADAAAYSMLMTVFSKLLGVVVG